LILLGGIGATVYSTYKDHKVVFWVLVALSVRGLMAIMRADGVKHKGTKMQVYTHTLELMSIIFNSFIIRDTLHPLSKIIQSILLATSGPCLAIIHFSWEDFKDPALSIIIGVLTLLVWFLMWLQGQINHCLLKELH
jgi:hypothetical protein